MYLRLSVNDFKASIVPMFDYVNYSKYYIDFRDQSYASTELNFNYF